MLAWLVLFSVGVCCPPCVSSRRLSIYECDFYYALSFQPGNLVHLQVFCFECRTSLPTSHHVPCMVNLLGVNLLYNVYCVVGVSVNAPL
jgi:hypothetical protein